jgi:hypothetical protein
MPDYMQFAITWLCLVSLVLNWMLVRSFYMTTGENVVVTWANAQTTLNAWIGETYYTPGEAERVINEYGGMGDSLDVNTVPDRGSNRDDFCDKLRHYYGACINLRESKGINPKLMQGNKP